MMKKWLLYLAAGTLGAAGAAAAQTSAPTTATPETTTVTAPAKSKKEKKVCRERGRSGSHLANVVCKTPEQWAELQEQLDTEAEYGIPGNRTATGRAMNRGTGGGGPPR
jgi:hypothetical protein